MIKKIKILHLHTITNRSTTACVLIACVMLWLHVKWNPDQNNFISHVTTSESEI